ncbi:MAG: hypothetical protein A2806_02590 [Candidatus Terrybacteria bacterium RIFCSPHIGHO2_01_FULL_48_17]|uniref:Uncharacterized protein n=1 Tax=Candidatus Terrybacteria bacterium RIFCSPHIGHO2_01_FULL_48_17 TaxID=1802362 RepID=A0A1G2PI22_9BACT|nr:MAG: hypothetical protein A2806_02590 [Candidatus Terrybacteria bacterium RIFCSPHIGHO2_01_FULL_48_17]OHA52070.1 MAG: hypothetical protein A3A30_04130 [Candidatus Terrybacteria bacterium RIFCSPLOWO2_01_FULL_48_14]
MQNETTLLGWPRFLCTKSECVIAHLQAAYSAPHQKMVVVVLAVSAPFPLLVFYQKANRENP